MSRRIGRYRCEAIEGTGTFATVYRAMDERLDDTVAVKVLAENHTLNVDLRERFLTEGRVLRRIDSPDVVPVHDLGDTDDGQPFLVLGHADRGTLTRRVADLRGSGWRPTGTDLLAVAEPLARALESVHRADVVHRDVNPGNVLLTTRGAVRRDQASGLVWQDERLILADLGLCKDLALSSGHTSAGGTEGFRPPELRRGPAAIDPRADLWSLSALMVWLVTGSPPGPEPVEAAVLAAGLPVELARVLDRGLAPQPAGRQPDAATWSQEVAAALRGTPVPPSTPVATANGDAAPPLPPAAAGGTGGAPATPHGWAFPPPGQPSPWAPPAGHGAYWPHQEMRPYPVPTRLLRSPGGLRSLWHSGWLLATLPLGLTTWCGFLYVGLRTGRRHWLWAAAGYGLAAVVTFIMIVITPYESDGETVDVTSVPALIGIPLMILTWVGGMVHALVANIEWLRWHAGTRH